MRTAKIVPCVSCQSLKEKYPESVRPCKQYQFVGIGCEGRFYIEDIPEMIEVLQKFQKEELNSCR